MALLIHAIGSEVIAYPATLDSLRQEYPNCSFPIQPTAEDLAPFNRFYITPVDPPSCDPRTEKPEHSPTLTESGWQQTWSIRPATAEEIAIYDLANQPSPDWVTFRGSLLISEGIAQVMATARLAGCEPGVTALPVTLEKAVNGDVEDFAACWSLVASAGQASPEMIAGIVSTAQSCNLPAPFIDALQIERPATGQTRDG